MSINFFDPAPESYRNAADMEKDLNLKVIARAMAGEEYGDVSDIMETLLRPLRTEDAIEKRLAVVMDGCERKELVMEIRKILVKTCDSLSGCIKAVLDCRGRHLTEDTVIGANLEAVRTLVYGLAALDELLTAKKEGFLHSALDRFRQEFYREISPETIAEQKFFVDNLDSFKNKGAITLRGYFREGFYLKDVEIADIRERAKRIPAGIFTGKRNNVRTEEEVYESGVAFTNDILLQVLESLFPCLQKWQKMIYDMKKQAVFLAGCARLYQRGKELGMDFGVPDRKEKRMSVLYELSLALQTQSAPVPNSLAAPPYKAIIVTGANQGGKSTFLRSMGIAQVMCQAGMYVPAEKYPLHAYQDIFTHFTRREDAAMNMGKFEEELKRMQDILQGAVRDTLILLNESFATTTEVTAYQIAMDLAHACMEEGITLWMVTHITKFARELYEERRKEVLFLSAGRVAKRETLYKMLEKPPENTSYGMELYEKIIGGNEVEDQ